MTRPHFDIVFTGGGTAGHLFPGLAVADELSRILPRPGITFAGSGKDLERRHVGAAGYEYLPLPARPLPRRLLDTVRFLGASWSSFRQAAGWLRRRQATVVIGLGGYASVPMAQAAIALGVPLVLLEQNVVPGRATRWLARGARLVCVSFQQTRRRLVTRCPIQVTGNPLRAGFSQPLLAAPSRDQHGGRLVVLGGSGGAHALNENVPRALGKIRGQLAGWDIVHQTGWQDIEQVKRIYRQQAYHAEVTPFIQNMPWQLAHADLAICRAGGTTLAELAATGLPAVLVPYPHAADDHQRRNAELFAAAGACTLIDQRESSGRLEDRLAHTVGGLLCGTEARRHMSTAIRQLARHDATQQVASSVHELMLSRASGTAA